MTLSVRLSRLEEQQAGNRSRIIVVSSCAGASSDELRAFIAASGVQPTGRDWIEYETNVEQLSIDVMPMGVSHEQALELID